ncbi:GNAT family N-acetyltransferase [Promicromonospora sp. Populi]|uniref:GNAT family N-acetyltransferase n=1 Tax=Promicromonospora sp. Populi TaxID=3239420 RepID=UPI0034E27D46
MAPEIYSRGVTATGSTVALRGWTAPDLDAFRAWLRPEHDWHCWDGPYYPVPIDAEADSLVTSLARDNGLIWAPQPEGDHSSCCQDREQPGSSCCAERPGIPPSESQAAPPRRLVVDVDGELVGTVAWYWESRETEWARMGVTVYDPAVRGRGIGRTALALWTSLLFERTPWVRLDFATWSGNRAMLSVGTALGFVEEARFRQARVVEGVRYDSVVMGVLRDEWCARTRRQAPGEFEPGSRV